MANDEILLKERLHNYLEAYIKKAKLPASKFSITNGSNKGDNYVGLIYRVTMENSENGEIKKKRFIIKTTRIIPIVLSESLKLSRLFQRETFFYQEVLPTFRETLKEHGIIERFPIFYDADNESGKEILMLEDLSHQNFVMKSSKILDYPHLSLTLRCLGELHAYSFIIRVVNPKSFDKFKQMKEPIFDENLYKSNPLSQKFAIVAIKALADEDEHYVKRFRQFSDKIMDNMCKVVNGALAEPYAVVNHGDAWTNNILFKYDQDGETPYDLRFIDFQLSRYASPVLDLVYILFCCCTQETRSKYYDQLVHEYYETLSKFLKKYGYDPDILFPYEALLQQFRKFGMYAAGMALYVIHLFSIDDSDLDLMYNSNLLEERIQTNNFYKSMLKGTLKDLIDRNYI